MKYIALTGGIGTGKTTLARYLEAEHNYKLINYTDQLKQLASNVLSPIKPISVDEIKRDKKKYRGFLQTLSDVIGYATDPQAVSYYVDLALVGWYRENRPAAVFDNVRTDQQAIALRERGFKIVRLQLPESTESKGDFTRSQANHHVEGGISEKLIHKTLATYQPISYYTDRLFGQHEDTKCSNCNNAVWVEGEDARGANNRKLCRGCWVNILRMCQVAKQLPKGQRLSINEIASMYGVSPQAVQMKLSYLIRAGVR